MLSLLNALTYCPIMQQVRQLWPLAYLSILLLCTPSTGSFSLFLRSTCTLSIKYVCLEFWNGLQIFEQSLRGLLYLLMGAIVQKWLDSHRPDSGSNLITSFVSQPDSTPISIVTTLGITIVLSSEVTKIVQFTSLVWLPKQFLYCQNWIKADWAHQ